MTVGSDDGTVADGAILKRNRQPPPRLPIGVLCHRIITLLSPWSDKRRADHEIILIRGDDLFDTLVLVREPCVLFSIAMSFFSFFPAGFAGEDKKVMATIISSSENFFPGLRSTAAVGEMASVSALARRRSFPSRH
ncbi:hypothetical protein C5748_12845 [Phyllobacterium phragmitis]|uniref:Uncharacterized protein n=1 Tax=Phyllobacterium phragmitis TaxID=2670329 RepID=A0A2S9IRE8_9HYPH|nr:hypothetical protein [Phyllobacterium phragmitis]PRD43090.1 hypothetical protein C5748_12845 [Phyllobacterium phragmitis]